MARSFAITTAKQTCALDTNRKGEASFTVTNTTDRMQRGRLKIKALDNTKDAWITLAGDAEREFAANGTQQVSAKIAVPASAAAGRYNFRLDAISVAEPDEDYTEGQTVAIEVAAPKPESPKRFPWWIPAVIVLVLLIIGAVVWMALPDQVTVPEGLVGKTYDEASAKLKDLGLVADKQDEQTDKSPAGRVIGYDPKASTKVDKGATVTLTVAQAKRIDPVTPDVSGAWESNDNGKYSMIQQGRTFSWKTTHYPGPARAGEGRPGWQPNEVGQGQFGLRDVLAVTWTGSRGPGSTTGQIAFKDDRGLVQVIKWANGSIWIRPASRIVMPTGILSEKAAIFKHFSAETQKK